MKDTKGKIIEAAISILNKNQSASIEQIAAEAGITRRTIHRYFSDRLSLIEHCKENMLTVCNEKMSNAYKSSQDPITQIEYMLYAAIEVGNQYCFLKKLYQHTDYSEIKNNNESEYNNIKLQWFKLIENLQSGGYINTELTIGWIYNLFGGIIETAVLSVQSGNISLNDVKKFGWISFKGGIGLHKSE
ncbi:MULTISPECIES: TetR/AcrR family transcriptional regulator [Flavobacterium]|uniref:TetR/AcrR family transcriptional regulator n=1 Tax=Flavobacterium TaxID=237 RepID=UPI0021156104|nr:MULTISPECIES: TetR/AcrR family transcriptional regulator [Flavobacterium]UUF13024.1 TetR/AcrR family transcriptional regulator [Flavobacterium panici]